MTAGPISKQSFKKALIIAHDLAATALAVAADVRVPLRGRAARRAAATPADLPAVLRQLRGRGLLVLHPLPVEVALRLPARPVEHRPRRDRPGADAAGDRLPPGFAADLYGFFFFGKVAIVLYWLLQIFLLGGPRLAYRYVKYARTRSSSAREATTPSCCSGAAPTSRSCCARSSAGTIKRIAPAGILSPREDDLGQSIRGVPVLGDVRRSGAGRRRPRASAASRSGASWRPRAR